MAANLVAIAFEGEQTANGMLATLRELEDRGAIKLKDAAIASRAPRGERVILSPAVSGDTGGQRTGMSPAGVASNEMAQQLQPDSSAIFLLVEGGDADQVLAELRPFKGRVLHTTLPEALDKQVRDALSDQQ
jgi:uncharacterized membrane protein